MKLRKHRNNKSFLITFTTREVPSTFDSKNPVSRVWAVGSCKQSVMRAFLFGRDALNMTAIIREATDLRAPYERTNN